MMRKNTVKYLRNRTLQRLYGDTCLQLATLADNFDRENYSQLGHQGLRTDLV